MAYTAKQNGPVEAEKEGLVNNASKNSELESSPVVQQRLEEEEKDSADSET